MESHCWLFPVSTRPFRQGRTGSKSVDRLPRLCQCRVRSATMKGVLPMYSCCLRALAKQATSTSRYAAGEAQMAAAVGIEAGNMVKKSHRHHLHSSRAASAYPSPASAPQASTSAAPSGFLQYTTRASSTVSNVQSNDANTMYYQPSAEQVTSHLNTLLEGLQPPLSSELAMRMVTHKGSSSANLSSSQHNTKLSLIGEPLHPNTKFVISYC